MTISICHDWRKIWHICFGGAEQTKASSAFTLYYSPANAWRYCYIIIFFIIVIIIIVTKPRTRWIVERVNLGGVSMPVSYTHLTLPTNREV